MAFERIAFNLAQAESQLASFKLWMVDRPYFSERDAVREIAARAQMACLLGYTIAMPTPDLIKFEFGIKGLYRADLVVGNDKSREFVLVEFESALDDSLFKGGRNYRSWSPRLEHGFGQVVDWAWSKYSHPVDAVLANAFGGKIVRDCYVVVCGRSPAPGSMEEQRFDFRRSSISLNGVHVRFHTYDHMVDAMSGNLTPRLAR